MDVQYTYLCFIGFTCTKKKHRKNYYKSRTRHRHINSRAINDSSKSTIRYIAIYRQYKILCTCAVHMCTCIAYSQIPFARGNTHRFTFFFFIFGFCCYVLLLLFCVNMEIYCVCSNEAFRSLVGGGVNNNTLLI